MRLYDPAGNRLYLDAGERAAFLATAALQSPKRRLFAETLFYTGCRISEALELSPTRFELSDHRVILRSLKKRRTDVFRTVPVPARYLDSLELTFGIRQAQKRAKSRDARLWDWSRVHGWQVIKAIMDAADIPDGPHKTPKGLRHSYGINAISNGIPLNMLQKWLGHAQLSTTAIYANASGKEESAIAASMWET